MGTEMRRFVLKVLVLTVAVVVSAESIPEDEVSSGIRTARSITNIARLLLGGNVPPDHPLVKYPDTAHSGSESKLIAAVPGMAGKKPEYSSPPSFPIAAASSTTPQTFVPTPSWQQTNQGYIAPPVQQAQLITSQQAYPAGLNAPSNHYNAAPNPYNAPVNSYPAPGNPYNAPYNGGGGSPGTLLGANGFPQQPLQQQNPQQQQQQQQQAYNNQAGSLYPGNPYQQAPSLYSLATAQYPGTNPFQSYAPTAPIYQSNQGSYPQAAASAPAPAAAAPGSSPASAAPQQTYFQGSYAGQAPYNGAQGQSYYGGPSPYLNNMNNNNINNNPVPVQSYSSLVPPNSNPQLNPNPYAVPPPVPQGPAPVPNQGVPPPSAPLNNGAPQYPNVNNNNNNNINNNYNNGPQNAPQPYSSWQNYNPNYNPGPAPYNQGPPPSFSPQNNYNGQATPPPPVPYNNAPPPPGAYPPPTGNYNSGPVNSYNANNNNNNSPAPNSYLNAPAPLYPQNSYNNAPNNFPTSNNSPYNNNNNNNNNYQASQAGPNGNNYYSQQPPQQSKYPSNNNYNDNPSNINNNYSGSNNNQYGGGPSHSGKDTGSSSSSSSTSGYNKNVIPSSVSGKLSSKFKQSHGGHEASKSSYSSAKSPSSSSSSSSYSKPTEKYSRQYDNKSSYNIPRSRYQNRPSYPRHDFAPKRLDDTEERLSGESLGSQTPTPVPTRPYRSTGEHDHSERDPSGAAQDAPASPEEMLFPAADSKKDFIPSLTVFSASYVV